MIEESATVVDIDSHGVWVETIKRSACESCSASNGCGQKLLVSRSSNKRFLVNVSNPKNITVEKKDTVLIGIEEGAFLKATLLVYLLPLVFLITGAVISQLAGFSEPYVIGCSILSLLLGLAVAKGSSKRLASSCRYQPALLKVI